MKSILSIQDGRQNSKMPATKLSFFDISTSDFSDLPRLIGIALFYILLLGVQVKQRHCAYHKQQIKYGKQKLWVAWTIYHTYTHKDMHYLQYDIDTDPVVFEHSWDRVMQRNVTFDFFF